MQKVLYCSVALLLVFATPSLAQQANGVSAPNADMSDSDMNANHEHPTRPVNSDLPIPSLTHLVFPDAMDGYNVQILSKNFRFTPAAINREVVPNEGHAHIYVNGVKIGRVYSHWYHLPSSLFSAGVNAVTVTLNGNDHSAWATPDGKVIESTVPVIRK